MIFCPCFISLRTDGPVKNRLLLIRQKKKKMSRLIKYRSTHVCRCSPEPRPVFRPPGRPAGSWTLYLRGPPQEIRSPRGKSRTTGRSTRSEEQARKPSCLTPPPPHPPASPRPNPTRPDLSKDCAMPPRARTQRAVRSRTQALLHGDGLTRVLLVLLVVQRAPEKHDVGLRLVDGVVDPPARLLDPQRAPLGLGRRTRGGGASEHRRSWPRRRGGAGRAGGEGAERSGGERGGGREGGRGRGGSTHLREQPALRQQRRDVLGQHHVAVSPRRPPPERQATGPRGRGEGQRPNAPRLAAREGEQGACPGVEGRRGSRGRSDPPRGWIR